MRIPRRIAGNWRDKSLSCTRTEVSFGGKGKGEIIGRPEPDS